jgi:hypothetical protein
MLVKKSFLKKNMAILACIALVSLFLPDLTFAGPDTPSKKKDTDSATSMSGAAQNFFIATVSIDTVTDGLASSGPRNVQGNSKSKKKPGEGGD